MDAFASDLDAVDFKDFVAFVQKTCSVRQATFHYSTYDDSVTFVTYRGALEEKAVLKVRIRIADWLRCYS